MPATVQATPQHLTPKQYLQEQLQGFTPLQLLLKVYDVAIGSCTRKDRVKLSRALVELISALNFEHREAALPLFRLYNFCLRKGKMGHFDVVRPILCELRDTWSSVQDKC